MTTKERTFDIILWGATGFTGQLVATYLLKHYGAGSERLTWAIAGRNQQKLEQVRDQLCTQDPSALNIPILHGDSNDISSLRKLASQARVIATTVGPYNLYGSDLVEACVKESTHYCDLTGEVHWAHAMIQKHHEAAHTNQCKIVNFCGYDSIPSDLGALMVQQAMQQTHGTTCEEIKYFAGPSKGGASGGTIASALNTLQVAKDKQIRRILGNPYSLHPEGTPKGPRVSDQKGVRWDQDLQQWTAPFIMANVNTRVVRRSNALLHLTDPSRFLYTEVMSTGKGFGAWSRATTFTTGLGMFGGLLLFPPTRALLKATVLPAPGEGPSPEAQEAGYFTTYLIGKAGEHRMYGLVRGFKDPGYGGTAIMFAEAAIALAKDQDKLTEHHGVLTPASAIGMHLVDRLRDAGMTWKVSDHFETT